MEILYGNLIQNQRSVFKVKTNRVRIALESLGNENALGWSLCFDTSQLTFVGAVRGSALSNVTHSFNVNTSAVTQGRLGLGVAWPRALFAVPAPGSSSSRTTRRPARRCRCC